MDLLTDDITIVKPLLETIEPMVYDALGPTKFMLLDGTYHCVDFHGQVFKLWVNPASKRIELEQI